MPAARKTAATSRLMDWRGGRMTWRCGQRSFTVSDREEKVCSRWLRG